MVQSLPDEREAFADFGDKTVFAIVAVARTGSTLLQQTLGRLADAYSHSELFNPTTAAFADPACDEFAGFSRSDVSARNLDPLGFLVRIVAASPAPIVGYKIFDGHLPGALDLTLADPRIRKILLRRNPLDSFVSEEIARTTGVWSAAQLHRLVAPPRVRFDAERFAVYLARIDCFCAEVEARIRASGADWASVDYEDVTDLAEINRLAAFLGSVERFAELPRTLLRQNSPYMDQKVENFDELVCAVEARGLGRLVRRTPAARPPRLF